MLSLVPRPLGWFTVRLPSQVNACNGRLNNTHHCQSSRQHHHHHHPNPRHDHHLRFVCDGRAARRVARGSSQEQGDGVIMSGRACAIWRNLFVDGQVFLECRIFFRSQPLRGLVTRNEADAASSSLQISASVSSHSGGVAQSSSWK